MAPDFVINKKITLEFINNKIKEYYELNTNLGFEIVEIEKKLKIFNFMNGNFIKYYLVKDSIKMYSMEIFYNDDLNYFTIYTMPLDL
jgi:hypothetical protein